MRRLKHWKGGHKYTVKAERRRRGDSNVVKSWSFPVGSIAELVGMLEDSYAWIISDAAEYTCGDGLGAIDTFTVERVY